MYASSAGTSATTAVGQHQLHPAMKYLLDKFAAGVTAIHGDKILAASELLPGNVTGFMEAMGVPPSQADRNTLLDLAKATAGPSMGDSGEAMAGYAQYQGVTANGLAACHELKNLCEENLRSLTKTQKKVIMRYQKRVVTRIGRLLHKDPAALKLVQTLAGLGFFATAAWLQWSAKERAWKIGSWASVLIGAIRLLGNLMYNEAGAIHQGWKLQYTHLGMAIVSYTMEILSRCGVEVEADKSTMIASTMANLVPVIAFYMRNMESTIENTIFKFEGWRTGGAGNADAALLQPIVNRLRAFSQASADALAEGSLTKPGNRTAATGKEAEIEADSLASLLSDDLHPSSATWRQLFRSLLHEAIIKSPSLVFALTTGVILVSAAVNNVKALSDNTVIVMTILIECGLAVKNPRLTPEQFQYRLLVLILSRFGSIFFFAAAMLHEMRTTGRRDIYDKNPELAATMAHCNAAFVCILGLAVVPSFRLFNRLVAESYRRAARCWTAIHAQSDVQDTVVSNPEDELDGCGLTGTSVNSVAEEISIIDITGDDDGDQDVGRELDVDVAKLLLPTLMADENDSEPEDDPEVEAELDKIRDAYVLPALEEFCRQFEGEGDLPVSLLSEMLDAAAMTGTGDFDVMQ